MAEYYMFNKPGGCITARRDERHKTVMDYFPDEKRDVLFPVGRLDKDTEGFLLVTDDGTLAFDLMKPEHEVPKTYFFWVLGVPSEDKMREIEAGVHIYKNSSFETSPAKITLTETKALKDIVHLLSGNDVKLSNRRAELEISSGCITITEGKKHQVKRMLRYAGCRVLYLKRLKIAELSLDSSLMPGEYRPLSEGELELLRKSIKY